VYLTIRAVFPTLEFPIVRILKVKSLIIDYNLDMYI